MEGNNFLDTRFNFAVVLNADYSTIQRIKKILDELDDVRVIYQDMDRGKLWIKRGGEHG